SLEDLDAVERDDRAGHEGVIARGAAVLDSQTERHAGVLHLKQLAHGLGRARAAHVVARAECLERPGHRRDGNRDEEDDCCCGPADRTRLPAAQHAHADLLSSGTGTVSRPILVWAGAYASMHP